MTEGWAGWQKGCAIGCIGVVVLAVIVVVSGVAFVKSMYRDFDIAVEKRLELQQRFGTREEFVPWPDGAVPRERLAAFIEVRRALADLCTRFEAAFGQFERMEQYEDSEDGPPPREIFAVMRSAFDLAPLMGQYYRARNQALLDQQMSLGEYTYIMVTAYYSGPRPKADQTVGDLGSRAGLPRRARQAYLGMLRGQLRSLDDSGVTDDAWLKTLSEELQALESERRRRPWSEGLPGQIAASLEPGAVELEQLSCPWASEFELGRTRRSGLTIHSD
jgi:hypothetical protein